MKIASENAFFIAKKREITSVVLAFQPIHFEHKKATKKLNFTNEKHIPVFFPNTTEKNTFFFPGISVSALALKMIFTEDFNNPVLDFPRETTFFWEEKRLLPVKD